MRNFYLLFVIFFVCVNLFAQQNKNRFSKTTDQYVQISSAVVVPTKSSPVNLFKGETFVVVHPANGDTISIKYGRDTLRVPSNRINFIKLNKINRVLATVTQYNKDSIKIEDETLNKDTLYLFFKNRKEKLYKGKKVILLAVREVDSAFRLLLSSNSVDSVCYIKDYYQQVVKGVDFIRPESFSLADSIKKLTEEINTLKSENDKLNVAQPKLFPKIFWGDLGMLLLSIIFTILGMFLGRSITNISIKTEAVNVGANQSAEKNSIDGQSQVRIADARDYSNLIKSNAEMLDAIMRTERWAAKKLQQNSIIGGIILNIYSENEKKWEKRTMEWRQLTKTLISGNQSVDNNALATDLKNASTVEEENLVLTRFFVNTILIDRISTVFIMLERIRCLNKFTSGDINAAEDIEVEKYFSELSQQLQYKYALSVNYVPLFIDYTEQPHNLSVHKEYPKLNLELSLYDSLGENYIFDIKRYGVSGDLVTTKESEKTEVYIK